MKLNSDINVLGSLPDWNLINVYLKTPISSLKNGSGLHSYTTIKTDKSVRRFEKAISTTLIKFENPEIEVLVRDSLKSESISKDSLILLFWNASFNNELLRYLNEHVYFIAFYSGRITIKADEVVACLKDLKESEDDLKNWSESTLHVTASKYLTLLKKFGLMDGSLHKTIVHPYLNDKMLVLFVYWLNTIEPTSNLLDSDWLKYSFCEKPLFVERLMQKKYSKYFEFYYTGDKLKIEILIPYEKIYYAASK